MKPSAVTWAVLGLLGQRARSGYDLKRAVDRTIRHFWAASYGQIYPELRRLEEAGWITGAAADRGGRARRVYELTPAGRGALEGWLHGQETRIELRDESLLRLFFSDALPVGDGLGLLRARRRGTRRCSPTCGLSTTAAASRIRPSSTWSTAGRSTTANGESSGATARSAA